MKFSLSISDDEKTMLLQVGGQQSVLTAEDVENLISQLAERREKMMPSIDQSSMSNADGSPIIDALLPDLETVLMAQNPPVVVLAIGFQGLGWRSISLSVDQAATLAAQLLAQTRTASNL